MPRERDSVPARDADFEPWLLNLKNYVTAKTTGSPPAWTHIPADKVTELGARYDAWHGAFEATIAPHTSVQTEAKNDQRREAEGFVRPFIAQYLRFDPVTDEDRTAMNIRNHDGTRTSIGVPDMRPVITDLKTLGGFQVGIDFRDEAAPSGRALPYGMNGAVLAWAVGPKRIADYDALTSTCLMSRSPWTWSGKPEHEGQFLSCAARYQNEKGALGPWSEIASVVIG